MSAVFVLAACERCTVRGEVTDIQGKPLPGVSVSVEGGDAQAVTTALGQYKVRSGPGTINLTFMKTGYTPGRLTLDAPNPDAIAARTVELWRLPQGAGLYLFEDYHYHEMVSVTPKPLSRGKNDILQVIPRLPGTVETINPEPTLLLHHMPAYDLRLNRLTTAPGDKATPGAASQPVWIAGENLPIQALPIDEPGRALVQARLFEPLAPGDYALHWGSLDGYRTTDPRAFLFRVVDPNAPKPESAPAPEEAAQENGKKTPKKMPKPKAVELDAGAVDAEAGPETSAADAPAAEQ